MSKIKTSPFCTVRKVPVVNVSDKDFVHYMEVEEITEDYDPKKPSEFLIEKKYVEYERIPIEEYINSFASKVGLKNELKGIISKQQMDDFISTHKAQPGFVDLTALPDTVFGMEQMSKRLNEIWNDIPSDLKGTMTKEEFLKEMNSDKLKAYVMNEISKNTSSKDDEEGK